MNEIFKNILLFPVKFVLAGVIHIFSFLDIVWMFVIIPAILRYMGWITLSIFSWQSLIFVVTIIVYFHYSNKLASWASSIIDTTDEECCDNCSCGKEKEELKEDEILEKIQIKQFADGKQGHQKH